MSRRLFCELGPWAYRISTAKEILLRDCRDLFSRTKFARERSPSLLPAVICRHSSLIRRTLGDVDQALQENKAENLRLAVPHVDKILIRPGETFSFWKLVGNCTARKGYREGLIIKNGVPGRGIGGGMCQFTNLLHWMALHSPLEITEHHHHNGVDLFPDYGRKVPFGCGTSILYNYRDYRLYNPTNQTFQFTVWLDEKNLNGELRAQHALDTAYHIQEKDAYFVQEPDGNWYRHNQIYQRVVDKRSGNTVRNQMILENHSRVLYDPSLIPPASIRREAE
ncbi:MAG TPA: VanW family protein [Candidatus Merdivicinus intestinigallinarum]|nr:VanW family protein [Candidatus Merdivicinus intestinigallinarum]